MMQVDGEFHLCVYNYRDYFYQLVTRCRYFSLACSIKVAAGWVVHVSYFRYLDLQTRSLDSIEYSKNMSQ